MLAQAGSRAMLLETRREPPEASAARLRAALEGIDLLIVAGGDGTLHYALPAVVGSGVPVYHVAMGTENLFARQFRMDARPQTLERAINAWRVLDVDVGSLELAGEGAAPSPALHPFVLMCSIGPDAGVIRRLDAARRGPITHFSYVRPIAMEILTPSLPRLTIEADGKRLVDNLPGMAVIANSRQYAMRIDPARNASMTDGLLDVVFFPASHGLRLAAWVVRSRLGRHIIPPLVYATARSVRVTGDAAAGPPAYQIDGECGRHTFPQGFALSLGVRERSLRVLAP